MDEARRDGRAIGMLLWCIAAAVALWGAPLPATASCLGSGDAGIDAIAKDVGREPERALRAIKQALASDQPANLEQRAWLEVARAKAERMLGRERTGLGPALEDAAALPAHHPARLSLEIFRLYDADLLEPSERQALDRLRRALADRSPGEPATLCMKTLLASVQADYDDLNGEAFELAAEVYRHADAGHQSWIRAEAASVMGQVALRTDGDYARTLNREALRYFETQGMHDMVANEHFLLGLSWARQSVTASLREAERHFRRSEAAARLAGNPFAETYAGSGLCEVLTPLERVDDALRVCAATHQALQGRGSVAEYDTLISHAAARLAAGRPQDAMALLEPAGRDWAGWNTGYHGYRLHELRGRTHAALGDAAAAAPDFERALRELRQLENSASARRARLLQARFRVDQLEEDLARQALQAEEEKRRHRVLVGAGAIVLILLAVVVVTLVRHRRLYRRMAFTDPLTGLANRRYAQARLSEAAAHATARRQPLCLALIDLDRFKSCNDRYGHDAGDEALRRFAHVARGVLRPGDVLGRWGGEEFLLLLPGVEAAGAVSVLERLRSASTRERLQLAPDYPLQFSAGVALVGAEPDGVAHALARADEALYRAKSDGRNRTAIASP